MKKLITVVIVLVLASGGGFAWYYFNGPCGVNLVKEAAAQLQSKTEEFRDAFDVAASTSRMSLSGPVSDMQAIRRETNAIEVPACLENAKGLAVEGMQDAIDGFFAFLSEESDADVNDRILAGVGQIADASVEVEDVSACAPFCKADPYKMVP